MQEIKIKNCKKPDILPDCENTRCLSWDTNSQWTAGFISKWCFFTVSNWQNKRVILDYRKSFLIIKVKNIHSLWTKCVKIMALVKLWIVTFYWNPFDLYQFII